MHMRPSFASLRAVLLPRRRHFSVSLPNDIIFEILSRTPVKSLCRFRCVSKEWNAIISHPAFMAAHKSHAEPLLVAASARKNSKNGHDLLLMDMDGNTVRVIKGVDGFNALCANSHDGLICLTSGSSGGGDVVNLATGEVFSTSAKPGSSPYYQTVCGFGRAAASGVYKVVRIMNGRICEVLSFGDGSGWRRTQPPPTHFSTSSPVAVNGVLHFLVSPRIGWNKILCFDLDKEEWTKLIEGPQGVSHGQQNGTKTIHIAELNGNLCMVQEECSCTNIWLLTHSDEASWIKAYVIPMDVSTSLVVPLKVIPNGGKLLFYCYLRCTPLKGPVLRIYDPYAQTCTNIIELPDDLIYGINLCSLQLDHFVLHKTSFGSHEKYMCEMVM